LRNSISPVMARPSSLPNKRHLFLARLLRSSAASFLVLFSAVGAPAQPAGAVAPRGSRVRSCARRRQGRGASSAPEKINVNRGELAERVWQLPLTNLPVGIYRVDVDVADGVAWRRYFERTDESCLRLVCGPSSLAAILLAISR
jgi:hypothetical protein